MVKPPPKKKKRAKIKTHRRWITKLINKALWNKKEGKIKIHGR